VSNFRRYQMKPILSISLIQKRSGYFSTILIKLFWLISFVIISKQASSQNKIDSLEQLLTTELTETEKINIEISLLYNYLKFKPKTAPKYIELLNGKLDSMSNKEQLILFYIAQSIYNRIDGAFEEAKKAAYRALSEANDSPDSIQFKAKIYNTLGAIADDESDIKSAIEYQLIALRYAEKHGDADLLATVLNGVGRAYQYVSEYSIAKKYLAKAILLKESNNHFDFNLSNYYTNLSNCFNAEGKYDSSIYYLDKSIVLEKKYHSNITLITSYNNKAYTYFSMHNLPKAETTVLIALGLADSLGAEVEMRYPLSTYAEILFAQNKLKKAEQMINKSIELSKKYNDLYLQKYNLDLLYNIYLKNEDYKQALAYFKQKSIVVDSIYNVRSRKEIEKLALEYETEKKNKEIELLTKEQKISAIELKRSNQLQLAFLMLTLLAIFIILLLRARFKAKTNTNKIVKEAMKTDFEKKLSDSELQALRAQMNPHFLFNSLNSINSFIIKNNQEKASEYLSKFSKLIRQVLNNSKSSKVTLANELAALQLYIQMEALRFSNKFEYDINVDSSIEADYLEIPPLIIQPYVENSIWHGLMHKKEGVGRLLVTIFKEENTLICTIEDNGIGRAAARNIKSKSVVKQKSYGMNITQERLNYNNQKFKEWTNIEIIDLFDERNNGTGTRVVIKIDIR